MFSINDLLYNVKLIIMQRNWQAPDGLLKVNYKVKSVFSLSSILTSEVFFLKK